MVFGAGQISSPNLKLHIVKSECRRSPKRGIEILRHIILLIPINLSCASEIDVKEQFSARRPYWLTPQTLKEQRVLRCVWQCFPFEIINAVEKISELCISLSITAGK